MLSQRMQHVIQKANSCANRDLLGRRELGRMVGTLDRHNTLLFGLGLGGVCRGREVRHRLEGWKDATVQGERNLNLGLVGGPGDGRGASGERHDHDLCVDVGDCVEGVE